MVAPAVAPPSTLGAPKPFARPKQSNPGRAIPSAPLWTVKTADYNPQSLQSDYQALRRTGQAYVDNRLKVADDLYWQRVPGNQPFIFAGAPGGTNLVEQVVDTSIVTAVDKIVDYVVTKGFNGVAAPDDNPRCSYRQLRTIERLTRHWWEHNRRQQSSMFSLKRLARLIALRGGVAVQVQNLDPETAQQENGGEPCRFIIHDLINIAYQHGTSGLERVVLAKKRLAGSLPLDWQAKIGNPPADTEVDIYESWDRINYFASANGIPVVPQMAHGKMDYRGAPTIPIVLCLHDPTEVQNGDVSFATTGTGISTGLVGVPPILKLVPTAMQRSFHKTLLRLTETDLGVPYVVTKGNVARDAGQRTYRTADTAASVEVLQAGNALGSILSVLEYHDKESAEMGIGSGLLTGDKDTGDSGVAEGLNQTLPRALMDGVKFTLEELIHDVTMLAMADAKYSYQPSAAQVYQATTGNELNAPADHAVMTEKTPHPLSAQITGSEEEEITSLTFDGFSDISITISGAKHLPYADSVRLGTQFLSMYNDQTGEYPIPLADIYSDYLQKDDPLGAMFRKRLEAEIMRGDTPLGIIYGEESTINELEGSLPPQQIAQMRQALETARGQILSQRFQARIAQAMQLAQQAGQPPQQGQQPAPGAPPQQGAAPQQPGPAPVPPPLPGVPAPGQMVPPPQPSTAGVNPGGAPQPTLFTPGGQGAPPFAQAA